MSNKQGIRKNDRWLFQAEDPDSPHCLPGMVVVMSQEIPASAGQPGFDWFEVVDGMSIGTLDGVYALRLDVQKAAMDALLERTDWSRGEQPEAGWRHDLSWHNTPMESQDDPTVRAYLDAIRPLGLTWTFRGDDRAGWVPYGIRLAQAAYPLDATDANLRALGIQDSVERFLGEAVRPMVHSIVLLTPNDD